MTTYNQLQLREIFHLQFLKNFSRQVDPECYALKGGTNLRFFFGSFRYSEDMDIDVSNIRVETLKTLVMEIVRSTSFIDPLRSFGIRQIVPPDMAKAKQTETTQRFKLHLLTTADDDLFTKIEFSRRGYKGSIQVHPVSNEILRAYQMAPLLLSHYDIAAALWQKVAALAGRSVVQARDVFDLHVLIPQQQAGLAKHIDPAERKIIAKAIDNIYSISYHQFRDTVIAYLSPGEARIYGSNSVWDDIKLKTAQFLEDWKKQNA